MALRPGRCYREINKPSYTRKEYVRAVPQPRVVHYVMGNTATEFPVEYHLVSKTDCQIRHNALESARIAGNKFIQRECGRLGYKFHIRVYPHQILRENKMAAGAGADRISDGMRLSFGKATGTAARVRKGQEIITISTTVEKANIAKEALRRCSMKMPTPCKIELRKGSDLVKD
ncbi:50S ribosomal protein L16 [Methanococcus voltae]|uniref:Large ribosomal subunit protein uL16 n=2 Tax=Methanococcus voltae TaxID=2188 RepID=A0A8J7RDQ7_METVO|nr:50S ribosomal protein L16 [Methanococcus voltae]MBP2172706.1 large subunit ribosomal protein L10e [Methanococcus voltae]MBP2201377.1 large subunit ribosomal protein L10e [Methanococcus voltae]MCS3922171.1 large subunit ribosomal protein L10e [Methanococcus voltae PS]